MNELLRQYIAEVVAEVNDARVPNQLLSKTSKNKKSEKDKEEDMDEVNVVANIAGFTGPLGASSEDLKGPDAGPKKRKNNSARWK
jgi:hypothetical protein